MTYRELIESCPHEVCQWRPGDVIVHQGTHTDSIYLLIAGTVEVWQSAGDRSVLTHELAVADTFSEIGVLAPGPAASTVRATDHAWAIRVPAAYLASAWESSPKLAQRLHAAALGALMSRLRESNCEFEQQSLQSARKDGGAWMLAAC